MMRWLLLAFAVFCSLSVDAQRLHYPAPELDSLYVRWRIPERRPECIRLIFAGDLMQHMPQVHAARLPDGTFDYSPVFDEVKPIFKSADVAVVNLETTLTRDRNYSGYPCFRSPAALADAIYDAGIDVALLANNHCCDNGATGVRTTIEELHRCGIKHIGVFDDNTDCKTNRIIYIKQKFIHFALLNYTYGTNGIPHPKGIIVHEIDTLRMAVDLAETRQAGVDFAVVCIHWGVEYQRRENHEQRQLADFLHRHGADVVIGSHPHVVQPWYCDGRRVTVYSLGNFVSNQRMPYTDCGILAEVTAIRQSDGQMHYGLRIVPTRVSHERYKIKVSEP